jgi:6-phosphogluconolactonase
MSLPSGLFLLIFTSVAVNLSCAGAEDTLAASRKMQVYIGTFTGSKSKGIYSASFEENTGRFGPLELAVETRNPTFLSLHPNGRWLYAVNEVSDFDNNHSGAVSGFVLEGAGRLRLFTQRSAGGAGPCHLAVDPSGRCVLVANYGDGSVACLPIEPDGKLDEPACVIQHSGSSVRQPRQSGPHAHFITVGPDAHSAFVCDLGLDKVLVYPLEPARGLLDKGAGKSFSIAPGSGPRHLAFHPNQRFVYLINELASTLSLYSLDDEGKLLKERQTVSTLPPDFAGENTAAEVQLHPSGKFVYASNRGRNSLVVFAADRATGKLKFLQEEPTHGRTPRHFALDPSGRWLVVANQDSDNLVVFKVDAEKGLLTLSGDPAQAPSPACVLFVQGQ